MQNSWGELGYQDVLWLLDSLSSLYRQPFDAKLIELDFPPPYSLETFHEAARALGYKTGACPIVNLDWLKLPLPAVAFLSAVQKSILEVDIAQATIPILILKTDGHKLLYFRSGSQTPETISIEEIATQFEAELILVSREASGTHKGGEIPGFATEKKKFSFHWFIPELFKHKTIWRDVLLASLAIQLVGLATPLFTQVIIDKVVIHQSNSTLSACSAPSPSSAFWSPRSFAISSISNLCSGRETSPF